METDGALAAAVPARALAPAPPLPAEAVGEPADLVEGALDALRDVLAIRALLPPPERPRPRRIGDPAPVLPDRVRATDEGLAIRLAGRVAARFDLSDPGGREALAARLVVAAVDQVLASGPAWDGQEEWRAAPLALRLFGEPALAPPTVDHLARRLGGGDEPLAALVACLGGLGLCPLPDPLSRSLAERLRGDRQALLASRPLMAAAYAGWPEAAATPSRSRAAAWHRWGPALLGGILLAGGLVLQDIVWQARLDRLGAMLQAAAP
jgi:hypothetical protein